MPKISPIHWRQLVRLFEKENPSTGSSYYGIIAYRWYRQEALFRIVEEIIFY